MTASKFSFAILILGITSAFSYGQFAVQPPPKAETPKAEPPKIEAPPVELTEAEKAIEAEAKKLTAQLEEAYQENSKEKLRVFFQTWHKSVEPLGVVFIDDPVLKEVHRVYQAFYNPFDLERIGMSERGKDIYKGVEYVILQGEISYGVVGKNRKYTTTDNFRPARKLEGVTTVILTPAYQKALTDFIEERHNPIGAGKIAQPTGANVPRCRWIFLESLIEIIPGHRGGFYLETHPKVNAIRFNPTHTNALLTYRIGCQSGRAEMHKEGTKWVLDSAGLPWID